MGHTDFYKDIDSAPTLSSNNWIRSGVYRLAVTGFRIATKDYDGKQFQVLEFSVVEVMNQRSNSHIVGETVIHMLNMKHPKTASRIKQFVSAVAGIPQSSVTADKCGQLADSPEKIYGLEVIGDAYDVTKKDGEPFTVVDYRECTHVLSQSAAAVTDTATPPTLRGEDGWDNRGEVPF